MPPVCAELPEAEEVLTAVQQASSGQIPRNLSVSGSLSLEVFAGCCVMTLGLLLQSVPAIKPWDAKYGEKYSVLTQGGILLQLAWGGWIASSHIATPCQSNTFARWPQLRSLDFLDGLPGLQEHQQQLVDEGNLLMAWSVNYQRHCMLCKHSFRCRTQSWSGCGFSRASELCIRGMGLFSRDFSSSSLPPHL